MKSQVEEAKKIFDAGLEGLYSLEIPSMKAAKSLPKNTDAEKEIRRNEINRVRMIKDSQKTLKKHYSDGIEKFDLRIFDRLFEKEDAFDAEIKETVNALREASKQHDKEAEKAAKEKIKSLRKERETVRKKIKEVTGGVTSRCIPFNEEKISDKCVCCGKPALHHVVWGRQY